MGTLRAVWWRVSGSLWFIPSVMVAAATGAAIGLVELDAHVSYSLAKEWPRLFGAGTDGARGILAAIATSMMTVAGVVFSVTLVALSLAASQYSPRVLRTFMGDRPTQVVLGVFVSVFAYCLVVLRTVRGTDDDGFIPSLAILGGIILAFTAIGFLVFFIHHLATAIEASSILDRVTAGTLAAVESLFPEELGEDEENAADAARAIGGIQDWTPIPAATSGYIIAVDNDGLLAFARERGRIVNMERAIGEFTIRGQPLAWLSGTQPVDAATCDALNALYACDRERTLEQDAAFGIRQIVDMALKALSPGMNDQTTAIMCVDRLAEILVHLARRRIETPFRRDERELRVIAVGPGFADLVALALDDIRRCAGGKPTVLLRLLWAIEEIAAGVRSAARLRVLGAQAQAVAEVAERTVAAEADRRHVLAAAQRLQEPCR